MLINISAFGERSTDTDPVILVTCVSKRCCKLAKNGRRNATKTAFGLFSDTLKNYKLNSQTQKVFMKNIFLVGVFSGAVMAAPVFAQGYIGVGVGSSTASGINQTAGALAITGGDGSKTSVKIFGGFKFTPNWGIEAQYSDLGNRDFVISNGNVQINTGSVKASQFSLAGIGMLPLASNFSVFGKIGASNNSGKASLRTPVRNFVGEDSKTDLMIGFGITYAIAPQIAVRAEYEDFGKFNSRGNSVRGNNFSVGLQYSF